VTLRRGSTTFEIEVRNPGSVSKGVVSARLDGSEVAERPVQFNLPEDGTSHQISVVMG